MKSMIVYVITGLLIILGILMVVSIAALNQEGPTFISTPMRMEDGGRNRIDSIFSEMRGVNVLSFLRNITIDYRAVNISGTIVGIDGKLLLIRTADKLLPIYIANRWFFNGEVLGFTELLLEGFIRVGDEVDISALQIKAFNMDKPTLSAYIAIRITNKATGVVAEAILPFIVE